MTKTMPTVTCRRCGLSIAWVATPKGKRMPLDPAPNDDGNVFVAIENGKHIARVRSRADPYPPGVPFMPHFATCHKRPVEAFTENR